MQLHVVCMSFGKLKQHACIFEGGKNKCKTNVNLLAAELLLILINKVVVCIDEVWPEICKSAQCCVHY